LAIGGELSYAPFWYVRENFLDAGSDICSKHCKNRCQTELPPFYNAPLVVPRFHAKGPNTWYCPETGLISRTVKNPSAEICLPSEQGGCGQLLSQTTESHEKAG
jgi:hypothetical protein